MAWLYAQMRRGRELQVTIWTDQPKIYGKCVEYILALQEHGHQLRRPRADYLRDGVYELRPKSGGVCYRILYGFVGSHVALIALGTTKEDVVDPKDIDRAVKCLGLATSEPDRYTVEY
ncbi:MAG TPA: type II toxin-antitoxin system RelE/ParE family toxin [Pirellulales bacterium]|nr:type II toxin-antitoxin system RelE/ParE family toxin [Pirellulales bacterium]